jgi:predicted phosphodiesterase
MFRFIVNGHIHRKMVRRFGMLTVINAGSLGRNKGPGFLIIDFNKARIDFYEFKSRRTIKKGISVGLQNHEEFIPPLLHRPKEY